MGHDPLSKSPCTDIQLLKENPASVHTAGSVVTFLVWTAFDDFWAECGARAPSLAHVAIVPEPCAHKKLLAF